MMLIGCSYSPYNTLCLGLSKLPQQGVPNLRNHGKGFSSYQSDSTTHFTGELHPPLTGCFTAGSAKSAPHQAWTQEKKKKKPNKN